MFDLFITNLSPSQVHKHFFRIDVSFLRMRSLLNNAKITRFDVNIQMTYKIQTCDYTYKK